MNASIPGRYGFRRRSEQRQAALDLVWARTDGLVASALELAASPAPLEVQWASLPPGLDPADGELDTGRAARKRAQVTSLVAHALEMTSPGTVVAEFGAGSGHVGLLLAHLRPDVQVWLVEVKEYSTARAQQRIDAMGVDNCQVFTGTLDAFGETGRHFDLAVGLHTCGLLADAVLSLALQRKVAACLVPCCYGQTASFKQDHDRGAGTSVGMHPCSGAFVEALDIDGREAFAWCSKSADFTPGAGGVFDSRSDAFCTALRCMRTVDTDRLHWACEHGYTGKLGLLYPPDCSPKCSVLRIQPAAACEGQVEGELCERC